VARLAEKAGGRTKKLWGVSPFVPLFFVLAVDFYKAGFFFEGGRFFFPYKEKKFFKIFSYMEKKLSPSKKSS